MAVAMSPNPTVTLETVIVWHKCARKTSYDTRKAAKEAAAYIRKRANNPIIAAYKCRECGYWHVGKDQKSGVAKRLRRREGHSR